MTPQQIVALITRLFALWLLTRAPEGVMVVFESYGRIGGSDLGWMAAGATTLLFILGVWLLWTFPSLIARKIMGDPPRADHPSPPSAWVEAGICVVGIHALSQALPRLAFLAWYFATSDLVDDPGKNSLLTLHLVETALGLWFALRPASVGRLIARARRAGDD